MGGNEIAGDCAHGCKILIQINLHGYFLRPFEEKRCKNGLAWDMTISHATVGKMSAPSNGDSFAIGCDRTTQENLEFQLSVVVKVTVLL